MSYIKNINVWKGNFSWFVVCKKTYKCAQVEGNYEILQDRLDNLVDVFIGSKLHHFYTLKRTKSQF